jgi:hydrogenase nickel incorporation protein HypA/HybF
MIDKRYKYQSLGADMHETALMRNLIRTANEALAGRDIIRVDRVLISVGKFSNVVPDALYFAFEALTQEGLLKGAKLEIETSAAVAFCEDCKNEYKAESFPLICPICQSRNFMINSGEEVYIKSIICQEG